MSELVCSFKNSDCLENCIILVIYINTVLERRGVCILYLFSSSIDNSVILVRVHIYRALDDSFTYLSLKQPIRVFVQTATLNISQLSAFILMFFVACISVCLFTLLKTFICDVLHNLCVFFLLLRW